LELSNDVRMTENVLKVSN